MVHLSVLVHQRLMCFRVDSTEKDTGNRKMLAFPFMTVLFFFSGIELILFIVASMGLYFRFLLETVLSTQRYFSFWGYYRNFRFHLFFFFLTFTADF